MPDLAPPPAPLSYGSRPPWQRRRATRRRVGFLLGCGLVILGLKFGPHAWRFACDRYWYRQCLNFTASPDVAVYEELPPGSQKPVVGPPYVDGDDPRVRALMYQDKMLFDAGTAPPVRVGRIPACLVRMHSPFAYSPLTMPNCVPFCHGRTSAGGHQRLVCVIFPAIWSVGDLLAESMESTSCTPPDWSGLHLHQTEKQVNWSGQALPLPRRIFAGQPDPSDATHFTIEYEWPNATRGIIDGWLLDDDRVKLAIRPGPGDIQSAWESMRQHPERWNRASGQ